MYRNQEDDRLTERSTSVNFSSEINKKPYRVTVEFPLFLIMIAATLTGSALSNIILYRTCVHSLGHTRDDCRGFLSPIKNNDTKPLEQEVQKYVTFVTTVKTVLESVGPAILSLFLGAWSDTYGRKPLITWSLLGMTVTSMLTVIYSMIDSLGPWWYILTALPMSLAGSYVVLFTASYCYISDVSPTDKTTIRMTLVDATVSAGMVIGSLLAKDLIICIGNVYLLLTGVTIHVLAYSFACIFIPESLTGALQGGFTKLFDILLVKEMARECFKRRPNNGRAQIILLAIVTMISVFVMYGTSVLEYMYTREKLHWGLSDYNTFSAVGTAIGFVGGFVGIVVFQSLLGIRELIIAIFSVATAAAGFFIKAFAVTTWQMYLASIISVFKGLYSPLVKSYLSKSLPVEDIAKTFAMMCALEGIMPLIAPITFNTVYTLTISIFPGAFLVISGVLTVICVILLGFVKYYASRHYPVSYDALDPDDE